MHSSDPNTIFAIVETRSTDKPHSLVKLTLKDGGAVWHETMLLANEIRSFDVSPDSKLFCAAFDAKKVTVGYTEKSGEELAL